MYLCNQHFCFYLLRFNYINVIKKCSIIFFTQPTQQYLVKMHKTNAQVAQVSIQSKSKLSLLYINSLLTNYKSTTIAPK